MRKTYFNAENPRLCLCLLLFEQGRLPDLYLIPATAWQTETPLFRSHEYGKPGQSSEAEYGLNLSRKNMPLLETFRFEKMVRQMREIGEPF